MAFLKTILIILLVYYGLKILFQFSKPFLMRYIAKKAGQSFERSFGFNPGQTKEKSESEASIDKKPKKTTNSKSTVGEYVDFDEID